MDTRGKKVTLSSFPALSRLKMEAILFQEIGTNEVVTF